MSKTYTTEGIVLKRRDYREHDKLITVYTKEYGKLELIARGTKKIRSKLNSHLEPFYRVSLMGANGKGFDVLAGSTLIESYSSIREHPSLMGIAISSYVLELTDAMIREEYYDPAVFDLLASFFSVFDISITSPESRLKTHLFLANVYAIKLFALLGYSPEVYRCINCQSGILLPKNIFNLLAGGIVCEHCKNITFLEKYIEISDGGIKLLRIALEQPLASCVSLFTLPIPVITEFNELTEKLVLVHRDRPLQSQIFLSKM